MAEWSETGRPRMWQGLPWNFIIMSFLQPSTPPLSCRHFGEESLVERRFICGVAVLYFRYAEGSLLHLVCCFPCRGECVLWEGEVSWPCRHLLSHRISSYVSFILQGRGRKAFSNEGKWPANILMPIYHSGREGGNGVTLSLKKFLHMTIKTHFLPS